MKLFLTAAVCGLAGAASAQFFDSTSFANGDWNAAAGGPVNSLDFSDPNLASVGTTPIDLGMGVSIFANAAGGVSLDSLGLTADFDAASGVTSFTFTFDTAITALAWNHFNSSVDGGVTLDTGLNTYDIEALQGGGLFGDTIGVVEATGFTSATFMLTNPTQELWFIDQPLMFVNVPSPAGAGLLALGGLAAARRRR